jgi:SAM-dependent methyltransferase
MNDRESGSLLEEIDWRALDKQVSREQRNREVYSPAVSLFRWWARRPHALIGEILEATAGSGLNVSDPFSGGGTVALEAARRGHHIYAQDIHPWAANGLATALDRVDPKTLAEAGEKWLVGLAGKRSALYGTECPRHEDRESEILTTFWVRRAVCPTCQAEAFLYPYSLISLASRRKEETDGFFGCGACGHVTRSALGTGARRCSHCRSTLSAPSLSQLPGGRFHCRSATCGKEFPAFAADFRWQPVLVQRLCGTVAHIERPTTAERTVIAAAGTDDLPASLTAEIPPGLETQRLRRAGIRRWSDLYPPRQLDAMLTAAQALEDLKLTPQISDRLRLVICGASEMAGYASRWDRYYPKAFEATANHRFSLTGLAAETNLLAERGRGTLRRRLAQSVRAAAWSRKFEGSPPRRISARSRSRLGAADLDRPTVVQGSSTSQPLADRSVDLVLTDPPYYDDVQYAELASLFLAWAQATDLIPASVHVDLRSEAVPNTLRGTDTARYCRLLSAVFSESRRTLKPGGHLVLTFHNTTGRAWWALARALGGAGFFVAALAVAHAENETDHAKRGRRAFSRDLVIECRAAPVDAAELVIAAEPGEAQSFELLAAGRAVAGLAAELASGKIKRTRTYETFGRSYRQHLGQRKSRYIRLGSEEGGL